MVARQIDNRRTVIEQAVKNPSQIPEMAAQVGKDIIRQSQEAKITEGLSKARFELNALDMQYQSDYATDPMGGMDKYKQARTAIFDKYGKTIDPIFKRGYTNGVVDMTKDNDATMQVWGLRQARKNTVSSINTSMKASFDTANIDGQRFGMSNEEDLGAVLNFADSRNNLQTFGDKNLGEATTGEMLQNYDKDYMKSFVSGVAASNPEKAKRLLARDDVKTMFNDDEVKSFDKVIDRAKTVNEKKALGTQMVGESDIVSIVNNPDADFYQTMLQIDEAELNGKISYKTAMQARRVLNSRDAIEAKTEAPDVTDIVDRVHDAAANADLDDMAFMKEVQNIRADVLNKQASGKLRYSDVRKLNGQIDKLTADRLSDDARDVGKDFRESRATLQTSLPKDYHAEATRQLFMRSEAEPMMSRPKYNAITNQIIDDVNTQRRDTTVKKLQSVQMSDDDFLKSINASMDDVRETARIHNMKEEDVIKRLKAGK